MRKLKEYEEKLSSGKLIEQQRDTSPSSAPKAEASKEEETRKVLSQPSEEKGGETELLVCVSGRDGANVQAEIALVAAGEKSELFTGAEEGSFAALAEAIRSNVLTPYFKWKEICAPETKDYSIRIVNTLCDIMYAVVDKRVSETEVDRGVRAVGRALRRGRELRGERAFRATCAGQRAH
ncbi:MAG: hypothetical protein P4M11_08995 [Candidatus Pacebacteria bacterium]|nr:hypothetical protein [Candidatus Paceibacterota bacterium]